MIDPPRDGCPRRGRRQPGGRRARDDDHGRPSAHRVWPIGRTLGLAGRRAVTGAELEAADDDALRDRVRDADVYARVAPEHKLRLVRALQAQGEVVAMTGDGVNDAPALRQADIGVAMGRGGSAAAKEAADMVLADDDFGTLRAAIEEGRRVYDNLVKALSFVLPTSLGQALIIAVAVLPSRCRTASRSSRGAGADPLDQPDRRGRAGVAAGPRGGRARPDAAPSAGSAACPLLDRPDDRPHARGRRHADRGRARALRRSSAAASSTRCVDPDLALARAQTTAVTGAVLLQALYLLTCRSLTRPNREIGRWSNPSVYAGIGVVLAPAGALRHAPVHARRLRVRADRRARARASRPRPRWSSCR